MISLNLIYGTKITSNDILESSHNYNSLPRATVILANKTLMQITEIESIACNFPLYSSLVFSPMQQGIKYSLLVLRNTSLLTSCVSA